MWSSSKSVHEHAPYSALKTNKKNLENVFVKHDAPNHMSDPKGEWSKKRIQNFITEYVQKLISSSTPWSVTICQISGS